MSTQVTTNSTPTQVDAPLPDSTKDEKSSTTGTNNEVDVDVEKAAAQAEAQDAPAAKLAGAPGGLPDVPDGGLHAWLTIAGGFFTLFCTFGVIQAFGVFQDYYSRIFISDKTPSEISWIGSLQIFLLFAIGIIAGKIFDNGGFKFLMATGSLLYVFSVFMLSLAKSHNYYQVILSQGLGEGLGMGLLFLPTLSIISHYFRRRRSLAYGIVVSGTAFGGIVWPILFNRLFQNENAGFPWAVRASGFISLALLFLANLIMRTRLPSRKERPDAVAPDIKGVITDVPYLITLAGGCLVFWGLFFPFFYLELFAIVSGVDENLAFYSIPILNAGAVFGRTIPGLLADRYGAFNVIIPMTAISGGLIFALFGATTKGGVIVFALLYGFFSGAFISLISSLAASFSRNLAEVGVRIGIACFFMSIPLLTGTPISGALIGSLDPANADELTWWKAIVFNAVVVLAGCVVLTIARAKLVQRKGTVWV